MKVVQRYFAREIIKAVTFVLVAFLSLFAFFDFIGELDSIGRGGYKIQHAFLYVLLGMPGYVYEMMPIAALIGTIYVMAQFASRSEFTILRASGMSPLMAGGALFKVGVLFAALTILFGEFVTPEASDFAKRLKLNARGSAVSQEFRSGLWAKDVVREHGVGSPAVGTRFLNVKQVLPDGRLKGVKIFEFDQGFRVRAIVEATSANYQGNSTWQLSNVLETRFPSDIGGKESLARMSESISTQSLEKKDLISDVTPEILAVLFVDPERMSSANLLTYTRHLEENKQRAERYETAFWKKIFYPLAVFVMMALALPFAYMHFRSGGVSLKILGGIMLGVSFKLLNSLFLHVGMLNFWPPLATAILPSILFMLIAIGALWRVERY